MIFGIDFGTTYTLVSWAEKDKLNFLKNSKDVLFPTQIDGYNNIKLKLANNEDGAHIYAAKFFAYINSKINKQVKCDGVKNCVLTVPVRFDDKARNFVKSAAIKSGFNVLKLLSEPVAAAIYAVKNKKNGYYLIYDLGGGTFDLSLLKFHDDVFHIIAVDGLKNYGGINIDAIIAKEHGCNLKEAQKIKEQGNFNNSSKQKTSQSLQKTYDMVLDITKNYKIEELILAGGSSQLFMIKDYLKNDFNVVQDNEPSLMVAKGAALHAQSLIDNNHLLIDVVPFNLGIEVLGEKMETIIAKNSPIPYSRKQAFKKTNNQKVQINIVQGMNENIEDCVSLTKLEINCDDEFDVKFMIDCDGIVSVQVMDKVVNFSLIDKAFEADFEIIDLYNDVVRKSQGIELNKEQERLLKYLEQARQVAIPQAAKEWLKDQCAQLF